MLKMPLFFAATLGVMGLVGMAPAEARTHHHHAKHMRMSSSCGPTAYSHSRTRVGVAQDEPGYYSVHRRSMRVYREREGGPRYGSVEYRRDRRMGGADVDIRSGTRTESRSSAEVDSKTKSMHSDRSSMKGDKDRMGASDKADKGGADKARVGSSEKSDKMEGRSSSDSKPAAAAGKATGAPSGASTGAPSKAGSGATGASPNKPDQK